LKKQATGFTLIELVIAIAFMAILMAIAYPSFSQWQKNAQYKEAARQLAGAMTEARSRAISQNLEHEIAFDLGANKYMLRQGNRAANTLAYGTNPGEWTVIYSNRDFSSPIDIKAKSDCSDNSHTNYRFQFFPNGTVKIQGSEANIGSLGCICVLDKATGVRKFMASVTSAATGRVVIRKWNASSNSWN
jgi:prepilin-type N-terminal cleavage/methylation domain-containing protein